MAADRVGDRGFGRGTIARQAAVGPFDAAIAQRHAGLGDNDKAALKAVQMCDLFEPRLRNLVDLLTDADHDVRRGDQLMETGRG